VALSYGRRKEECDDRKTGDGLGYSPVAIARVQNAKAASTGTTGILGKSAFPLAAAASRSKRRDSYWWGVSYSVARRSATSRRPVAA